MKDFKQIAFERCYNSYEYSKLSTTHQKTIPSKSRLNDDTPYCTLVLYFRRASLNSKCIKNISVSMLHESKSYQEAFDELFKKISCEIDETLFDGCCLFVGSYAFEDSIHFYEIQQKVEENPFFFEIWSRSKEASWGYFIEDSGDMIIHTSLKEAENAMNELRMFLDIDDEDEYSKLNSFELNSFEIPYMDSKGIEDIQNHQESHKDLWDELIENDKIIEIPIEECRNRLHLISNKKLKSFIEDLITDSETDLISLEGVCIEWF